MTAKSKVRQRDNWRTQAEQAQQALSSASIVQQEHPLCQACREGQYWHARVPNKAQRERDLAALHRANVPAWDNEQGQIEGPMCINDLAIAILASRGHKVCQFAMAGILPCEPWDESSFELLQLESTGRGVSNE